MKIQDLFAGGRMPNKETKGCMKWRDYRLLYADTDGDIRGVFNAVYGKKERAFVVHKGHVVRITADTASLYPVCDKIYLSP